jgi:hypothetical protein
MIGASLRAFCLWGNGWLRSEEEPDREDWRLRSCDALGTIGRMEGGPSRQVVNGRADGPRAASIARFFSKQTTITAVVAVIALIVHLTGSTGTVVTVNQSVLVLAIVIAQVTMPHRHFRALLSAPSHTTRSGAEAETATTWQRRRDDPLRVRFCGFTVSPRAGAATTWLIRQAHRRTS